MQRREREREGGQRKGRRTVRGGVREERAPSGGYRESVMRNEKDESARRAEKDIKGVVLRVDKMYSPKHLSLLKPSS